ncbi:MOSC domain-containing protein [Priestia megaterium]|uniref:MOSC domain-containing protein n=1 Tax=Priestia megaterium TaxID=1404 RepID=UPI000D51F17C|nr:MOSC domain-containing protein [Priestia megaterium]PVE71016.1 MOSC domain-containing protein [Priestia megaterium]PVE89071.1 MOSC domain-containing protein [Priestia megaterium]PVE92761.1 MOSC domain-containing protein [Priestia megaterium]PVE99171.1 MOSC domain-containing protein [Priestia megaterium]RMA90751.1 MOSC domain-containing protein YiiM [Priestia megaterium]
MADHYKVQSLNYGKIETLTYGKRTFQSAIRKAVTDDPVFLSKVGLAGDEQAYKDHGGVDKALCLYPYEHYEYWNNIINNPVKTALFGENITSIGLTEKNAHIGDVFAFGESIIQVSEPRNPCYKLAAKYEVPDIVVKMRDTGYTGFLFRVLKEGIVSVRDELIPLEKDPHEVSIAAVNDVKFKDRFNKEKLERVLQADALSNSLREVFLKQFRSE